MITVLLFAHLQEEFGANELKIDGEHMTVAELKHLIEQKYQVTISEQMMVAVNEEYANEDDNIQTGDVVALIPPVSGG